MEKNVKEIFSRVGFSDSELEIIDQAKTILKEVLAGERQEEDLDKIINSSPFLCENYFFPSKTTTPLAFLRQLIDQEQELFFSPN